MPESARFKKIVCFWNNSDWVLKAAAAPSYPVLELGLSLVEELRLNVAPLLPGGLVGRFDVGT